MTTVLIIVCILFCIGVIVGIVGHLGYGITRDKTWRIRIHRHQRAGRGAGASGQTRT